MRLAHEHHHHHDGQLDVVERPRAARVDRQASESGPLCRDDRAHGRGDRRRRALSPLLRCPPTRSVGLSAGTSEGEDAVEVSWRRISWCSSSIRAAASATVVMGRVPGYHRSKRGRGPVGGHRDVRRDGKDFRAEHLGRRVQRLLVAVTRIVSALLTLRERSGPALPGRTFMLRNLAELSRDPCRRTARSPHKRNPEQEEATP